MLARHNPFATERVEQLLRFNPQWSDTTWEQLDNRWESLERRATVTGRHGAGKTSFLDAWTVRQKQITGEQPIRIFLNTENNRISGATWNNLTQCRGKTIILDGEEQLRLQDRYEFHRLTRNASGILVTRHTPGRIPTLLHLKPSMEVLINCIEIIAPQHLDQLIPKLQQMWKHHNANLRSILLECYDTVAKI